MRLASVLVLATACNHGAPPTCGAALERRIADELRTIEAGEQIDTTVDEAARTPDQRAAVARADALLSSHHREVDANDLAILDRTLAALPTPSAWNRADDRTCPADATRVSLFCALQQATIAVIGRYEHRRTALQEVRFAVDDATAGRQYEHRLRDYNNDPTTTLDDLRRVITVARSRVAGRLGHAGCTSARVDTQDAR